MRESTKKKIVIAGGSGFLGKHLYDYFTQKGYTVKILSRNANKKDYVKWDAQNLGDWTKELENAYALINMTGKSVDCRYTEANKKMILSSRLDSTKILGTAIAQIAEQGKTPPQYWLNSSTSTIYQHTEGDKPANTEKEGIIGSDFSMDVAKAWEKVFFEQETPKTKKTALRTAIVMGKDGGAFPVMSKLASFGLCSPQGNGQQWISWIHIDDFVRAVDFVLENELEGVVNMCSPQVIKNKDFNGILKSIKKPLLTLPQPAFLLKFGAVFIGTETELIM